MTGKEALENIHLKKIYHPDLSIDEEIDIIEKDLDKLEKSYNKLEEILQSILTKYISKVDYDYLDAIKTFTLIQFKEFIKYKDGNNN